MKFYLYIDGYGEPTIWHDPESDRYGPVPVVWKSNVTDGYWDELVRRLTGEES